MPGSPPDLRQISRDTLLELVRVHGPAFAAGTQPKPQARKSKDESRSGRALALAGKVRRRGGDVRPIRGSVASRSRASRVGGRLAPG